MKQPRRRSPRIPGFDYRLPAVYFVTLCAHRHQCVFGNVESDDVELSSLGTLARDEWLKVLRLRPYVEDTAHVVMPNHIHLLFGLWTAEVMDPELEQRWNALQRDLDAHEARLPERIAPPPMSVPAIIGGYKAAVTRTARRTGLWHDGALWQARYHDRIVRNERELQAIQNYITDNPRRWNEDTYAPK